MSPRSLKSAESAYLKRVLAELDRQIDDLEAISAKRDQSLRAETAWMQDNLPRDGSNVLDTAQALELHRQTLRSRREAEVRLGRLKRQRGRPYFGSFTFRALTPEEDPAPDRVYLGTGSVLDQDGELLVHDWRTPLATLYYDAEPGLARYDAPQGTITGELGPKRQYQIADGEVRSVVESGVYIGDELLREAISHGAGQTLHTIVETIQREQNRAIRHGARGTLVVSGPAGSGKTSVALQRIAYLLFRDRARLSADQVVFISPSPLFSRYVAAVLPELGEDNPRTLTFDDLLSRVLGPTPFESSAEHYDRVLEKPPGASQSAHLRWRASPAFTALLDTRLQGLSRDGMRFRDLGPGAETWVSRGTFRRWWREGDGRAPIDARLHTLRERARSAVRGRGYGGEDEDPRSHLAGQVLADLDRFDFVDWAGMLADWAADVEAPEAETHGALRLEDAVAIAYLRVRVLEPTDLFNARLVVVDEAQDYTPTHFALLRRLFRAADFTLVGDLHQAGDPYLRLEAWEDAVEALRPAHESHRCGAFVLPLWKTYRSAPAVMEYAARLLPPEVGQQIQVMRLGRGDEPPTLVEVASEELGPALIDILHRERAAGTRTLLVVARTAFEAGRLWARLEQHVPVSLLTDPEREYQGGYVVMPLYLAKGFEFQTVVIGNASQDRFSDPADARWLYIAMTRSLERVFIVSAGPRSGLLPPL